MDIMVGKNILSLDEMQEIARLATRKALKGYSRPNFSFENLVLGIYHDKECGKFELYIAGERPEDAIVISEATVNRKTGEVSVKVFLPKKPEVSNPPA